MTFSSSRLYGSYFEGMLLAIVSQWERTDSDSAELATIRHPALSARRAAPYSQLSIASYWLVVERSKYTELVTWIASSAPMIASRRNEVSFHIHCVLYYLCSELLFQVFESLLQWSLSLPRHFKSVRRPRDDQSG